MAGSTIIPQPTAQQATPMATPPTGVTGGITALEDYMKYLKSPEYKEGALVDLKSQFETGRAQTLEDLAKFNVRGGEATTPLTMLQESQARQLRAATAGMEKEALGVGLEAAKLQAELAKWQKEFGLEEAKLAETQRQFGVTSGLELDKFTQQKYQFAQELGLEREKFSNAMGEFAQKLALEQKEFGLDEAKFNETVKQFAKEFGLKESEFEELKNQFRQELTLKQNQIAENTRQFNISTYGVADPTAGMDTFDAQKFKETQRQFNIETYGSATPSPTDVPLSLKELNLKEQDWKNQQNRWNIEVFGLENLIVDPKTGTYIPKEGVTTLNEADRQRNTYLQELDILNTLADRGVDVSQKTENVLKKMGTLGQDEALGKPDKTDAELNRLYKQIDVINAMPGMGNSQKRKLIKPILENLGISWEEDAGEGETNQYNPGEKYLAAHPDETPDIYREQSSAYGPVLDNLWKNDVQLTYKKIADFYNLMREQAVEYTNPFDFHKVPSRKIAAAAANKMLTEFKLNYANDLEAFIESGKPLADIDKYLSYPEKFKFDSLPETSWYEDWESTLKKSGYM